MADRSPTKNAMLKKAVSVQELNESDVRGVYNTGFNDIYEECENIPNYDVKDGSFMVQNPEFNKKHDLEYMKELNCAPWYHGIISRGKAEDILNSRGTVGTFIVRSGMKEGEFYISVRAPEGGPRVLHTEVDRFQDQFVAVSGSAADPLEFSAFHELIGYLRSTPTYYEGYDSDVIFDDYVPNDDN